MTTSQLVHVRAYPAHVEQTGPRQLTGRLLPYNVAVDVLDELPDGRYDIYSEGFRPGAFDPQVNLRDKVSKIGLIHTHVGGLGYLGPFTSLREQPDGLYGDVRIVPSKVEDVAALLEAGVDELSVEFRLPRSNHTEVDGDGVRWRTRAHLDQVALEPKGAYRSAQVLAFRAEVDEEKREQAEAAADAEAAAEAAAAKAAAAEERRERWDAMTKRLDGEVAKQQDYALRFGVTAPGGFTRG
ncbi:MAG TPA: hypothetical protein VJM49_19610 [Acidimicrobiales bacterium]|nr:hypothetical protein [Acidimicrobiales bacterium]